MNLVAVLVGLTMLVVSVPFLAKPFQKERGKKLVTPVKQVDSDEQRLATLTALRDLDFDFQVGKVSEDDYTSLRARLVAEAARTLQDDKNDEIETLIQARKTSKAKAPACAHCGETLEAGIRFCPRCGTAVEASCPSCGKNIKAGDLFCSSCGSQFTVQTKTI
jgi:RNA polymerase subunit RPABC4/transcription elongation factor Spt4